MIEILNLIEGATELKPIPQQTTEIKKCIIYKHYQVSNLAHRLELRIIALKYTDLEDISEKIFKAIEDFGDTPKTEGIKSITLNGGGDLIDNNTNTYHRIMYFNYIKKGC